VPNHEQERKADSGGEKSAHCFMQFRIIFGGIQRNDEQHERQSKHQIAHYVQPGKSFAPQAESIFGVHRGWSEGQHDCELL
jgi:hypothetical protein